MIAKLYQTKKPFILITSRLSIESEQKQFDLEKLKKLELIQIKALIQKDEIGQDLSNILQVVQAIIEHGKWDPRTIENIKVSQAFLTPYNHLFGHMGPPTRIPQHIGDQWVDLVAKEVYVSFGDSQTNDWKRVHSQAAQQMERVDIINSLANGEVGNRYLKPDGTWAEAADLSQFLAVTPIQALSINTVNIPVASNAAIVDGYSHSTLSTGQMFFNSNATVSRLMISDKGEMRELAYKSDIADAPTADAEQTAWILEVSADGYLELTTSTETADLYSVDADGYLTLTL